MEQRKYIVIQKANGKWELRIIGKSWDLSNVQIQMSHDRFLGGEKLALCVAKMISRSTIPQRDYI